MSTQTHEAPAAVIPNWTFGDHLRKSRHVAGMDQRTFAEAIGATASQVASWETDRSVPRDKVAVAKRIELLTRIPATWVLGLGEWAPWGSNPQPTDDTSSQVADVIVGPWAGSSASANADQDVAS